jgi:hypothetical protein
VPTKQAKLQQQQKISTKELRSFTFLDFDGHKDGNP